MNLFVLQLLVPQYLHSHKDKVLKSVDCVGHFVPIDEMVNLFDCSNNELCCQLEFSSLPYNLIK